MLDKHFLRQVIELASENRWQEVSTPLTQLSPRVPVKKADDCSTEWIGFQSADVIRDPLEVSNYHLKFHELLKLEEIAHEQLLRERLMQSCIKCAMKYVYIFSLYTDVMGNTP